MCLTIAYKVLHFLIPPSPSDGTSTMGLPTQASLSSAHIDFYPLRAFAAASPLLECSSFCIHDWVFLPLHLNVSLTKVQSVRGHPRPLLTTLLSCAHSICYHVTEPNVLMCVPHHSVNSTREAPSLSGLLRGSSSNTAPVTQ